MQTISWERKRGKYLAGTLARCSQAIKKEEEEEEGGRRGSWWSRRIR